MSYLETIATIARILAEADVTGRARFLVNSLVIIDVERDGDRYNITVTNQEANNCVGLNKKELYAYLAHQSKVHDPDFKRKID